MSYDIRIRVKAEGCDAYPVVAYPELDSPTYNLGKIFRTCMNWDYKQSEMGEDGEYHAVYYPCDKAIVYIENGLKELYTNQKKYKSLEPKNGWGDTRGAIRCLESIRDCIYKQTDEIPLNCLYMSW